MALSTPASDTSLPGAPAGALPAAAAARSGSSLYRDAWRRLLRNKLAVAGGVTVILLTASYKDQEFIRVGYYVNNAYETEEMRENPPETVDLTQVRREVLVSKPRVTRFNIKW